MIERWLQITCDDCGDTDNSTYPNGTVADLLKSSRYHRAQTANISVHIVQLPLNNATCPRERLSPTQGQTMTAAPPDLPPCPRCHHMTLVAPGHCSVCGQLRLFVVSQARVIHATYQRRIWAPDAASAILDAQGGTEWPQSYDEDRHAVECGEFGATDVTAADYLRTDGGFEEPVV